MGEPWVRRSGWLRDYAKPRQRVSERPQEKQEEQEDESVVIHKPIRCPKKECRSKRVRCYGADRPTLYYRCLECKNKFKVIEEE